MSRPLLLVGLAAALLIALVLGLLLARPAPATALAIGQSDVVEVLRLRVPSDQRACWRQAEALSWEPLLRQQAGYRGRQLLWDPSHEEALLLIGWASRADWDAIPAGELESTQARFEAEARRCLGLAEGSANPFPLLSSGALLPEP